MFVNKKGLISLFLFLCVFFAQSFCVSAVQANPGARQANPGAGAGAGAGIAQQQEPTLLQQVNALVRDIQNNKCRTTCDLLPFLNFKVYGLADTATAALQIFPQFQEVMFGDENVTDASIIRLIRTEMQSLNIPNHNSIPIKRKTGRFVSAYESIIVHPTNKIIYVDEDFLTRQTPDLRAFIIKTALKHYLNDTFGKVSLMQLSLAGAAMQVVPKAQSFIKDLIRDGAHGLFTQPTEGTDNVISSTSSLVGNFALNIAVMTGTMWAWDKFRITILNAYVRRTQNGFDRQETDKSRAKRLLAAVAADAQKNPQDTRQDGLQERLCAMIPDELSQEWTKLKTDCAKKLKPEELMHLIVVVNNFYYKLPNSDPRKKEAQELINGEEGLLKPSLYFRR